MSTKTISELASQWDGRLSQPRNWRRSSSNLAHDSYPSPRESTPADHRPPGKFSEQKHAQQSVFRFGSERDSRANSSTHARPPGRVDTTSTSSRTVHRSRKAATVRSTSNSASRRSSFITSSKSPYITPDSSVHASRVHNSRLVSSSKSVTLSRPTSTMDSELIDLTLEDTEDDTTLLVPKRKRSNSHYAGPGTERCRRTASSGRSSPIAPEQSLFTPPPPPRRRTRLFIDYLAVPSFPKGLTKADYQPLFNLSAPPPPSTTVESVVRDSSLKGSPLVTKGHTPKKRKGKERELDVVSASNKCKRLVPADGAHVFPGAFLDALEEHAMIPLYDDDTYPPLSALDLLANSRFQFANAWREHASRLREAELDWTQDFRLLAKACVWARSASTPSPRLPGSAGYVSIEQLRAWILAPLGSSAQDDSANQASNEQAYASETQASAEDNQDLLDDAQPGPSTAVVLAPSGPVVPQGSAVGDMEHDMNQYFNGLGDSPAKYAPLRQELAPTHTFRPHLLQSAGQSHHGFGSLELDPRLTDIGNHECFLGVPPSPPVTDSPTAPGPIADPPSHPVDYFSSPPSNIFDPSPADTWSFEQGAGLLPDDPSPSNGEVAPTAIDTIDPSLLGLEQSQEQPRPQPQVPKDSTPQQRSRLPVIYVRRPIDSSSMPLLSGKRSVQIKYRDSGGSPPTPSTRTPSKGVKNSKQSCSDGEDHSKRRSAPSRKLRESQAAPESDSDYIPEPSTLKIKLKLKRPSVAAKESVVEHENTETEAAPAMSYCHQCRNKSARPKMSCSNVVQDRICGKRFCNRCIMYRYPDVTFDEHSAGFLCPVCTNTCNCSFCSRNRGEEFVSMRLGGLAASLLKTKVTLVRDGSRSLPRTQTPPPPRNVDPQRSASTATTPTPEPSTLPVQPQFWAHVYGMEGERMGSAFMTRDQMERLQTQGPSPAPLLPKKKTKRDKKREKPRGPRVFIGRPLDAWKLRGVRDLEPSVDVVRSKGKDMDKAESTDGRRRRYYVGDLAPLYGPYGRMPGSASPTLPPQSSLCSTSALDSDGSLTPLSELEEGEVVEDVRYWPQPDVGEYCAWAPPPPPETVVHRGASDASGLSGPLAMDVPILGPLGVEVEDLQGQGREGQGLGLGVEMNVDVGEEPASASTVLSEEELARVISVALAALSVTSPS